jgi:hypothetical protein
MPKPPRPALCDDTLLHCNRCDKDKPKTSFHQNKRDGGWQAWCASCKTEWRHQRKKDRPYKKCPKCGEKKLRQSFPGNVANMDGLGTWCKKCNVVSARARSALSRYGITQDEYDQMILDQGGVCAICGEDCPTGRRLAIDHDHKNGQVRALLCTHCNRGLGAFRDSVDLLVSAIEYLRSFSAM